MCYMSVTWGGALSYLSMPLAQRNRGQGGK